jgi:hypothetical protein
LFPRCHTNQDKKERLISFLLEKCGDLRKLFEMFPSSEGETKGEEDAIIERCKGKKIIVKGFVQSGKTNFIISTSALFNILGNKNIVIITRNSTDDKLQLENRLNYFDDEIMNISEEFADEKSKIFIEIGNSSRIKKLLSILKRGGKDYILFIDEVDYVDSVDTKTTDQLSKLRNGAYCIFSISATIMDPILKSENSHLIILTKPDNYSGIESFAMHILPNENSVSLSKKDSNLIDDNIKVYLEGFSRRETFFVPIYDDYHPVDTLIRVSTSLDPNRRLLSYIASLYPSIPCMFYSGRGTIELHLVNITNSIELADGSISEIRRLRPDNPDEKLSGLYHCFSGTSPSYVKQWLYENGGVRVYPRIITLAGTLAARSISYGASNFEECKKTNKLWWHLSEMYFYASTTMDQPELMQTAGRLCVSTPLRDNVPLTLYTTKSVKNDLVRSFWLQEELIGRAKKKSSVSSDPLWKLIEDMPIYKGKIPTKKRKLAKKILCNLNEINEKDDGGYEFENYKCEVEDEKGNDKNLDVLDISNLTQRRKEAVRLLYNVANDDWIQASTHYRNSGDQQAICHILKGRSHVSIKVNKDFVLIRKIGRLNRYEFKIERSEV